VAAAAVAPDRVRPHIPSIVTGNPFFRPEHSMSTTPTPAPVAAQVSLLEFPCAFPIKIMGRTRDGFAQAIVEIVHRHAPDFDAATLEMRSSSAGNYLSMTATINATSREQLDDLYRELVAHPMVAMVL
jgi:putative lipoic acid-binding regulatory protein